MPDDETLDPIEALWMLRRYAAVLDGFPLSRLTDDHLAALAADLRRASRALGWTDA